MKRTLPAIVKEVDKNITTILIKKEPVELAILEKIKNYVVESGGKRVRPILLILLSDLFDDKRFKEAASLGAVVEIIHAASLLHDDVLDNADTRRGKPSGKALFGANEVILAGDYLLACAIEQLSSFEKPQLLGLFTKTIRGLSVSELLQLEYAKNPKITMDIYQKVIYGKTASLFESAAASVAVLHNLPKQEFVLLSHLGKTIGRLFQMRDDYLDYFNASLLNKPAYTDFINGLFTYPVLLLREISPQCKKKTDVFFALTEEERSSKQVQQDFFHLLNENQIKEKTLEKLKEEFSLLINILSQLPEHSGKELIEQQFHKLMKLS